MIGSQEQAKKLGIRAEDILGMLDPKTLNYFFQSDQINLENLIQEIRRVAYVARRLLREIVWPKPERR